MMRPGIPSRDKLRRGRLVAEVLAGAWRLAPSPLHSGEALAEVAPLLLESGAAGLGWWRVRHAKLSATRAASDLQQTYRFNTLEAALQEREIGASVALLRSAGVEPLLGKGWAAARLYPSPGMRPRGDVDLYVAQDQHPIAMAALSTPEGAEHRVDLHRGFAELDDRNTSDLYERGSVVQIGGTDVRIFGPEDHLRLLSLHLLRHGAWRPLWLCDVAAALESRCPDFDWEYFGRGDARRNHWIACVLGLAHQLLQARLDDVSSEWRPDLPRWLIPSVLREWGDFKVPHGLRDPMAASLLRPADALRSLRIRWPNAIEATVGLGGAFTDFPRAPFQIGECLRRIYGFVWKAFQNRFTPR